MRKKILFRLLNKKGWLCFGFCLILIFLLTVPVHASYVNSYAPSGVTCPLYSFTDDKGIEHVGYAEWKGREGIPNSGDDGNIRIAFYNGGNRRMVSNYEYGWYETGSWEMDDMIYSVFVGDYTGNVAVSNVRTNASIFVPSFSDVDKLNGYINGTLDISECDNWNEIQNANASYDSSIPVPDDLSISSCSASGIQAVWTYSDNSKLNYNGYPLQYDVKTEYFYSSMSATSGLLFGHSGSGASQGLSINSAIGNLQTVEARYTVEDYLAQGEALVNDLLKSATVDKKNGPMSSVNTFSGVPVDYSDRFVSSGNPFFTGATNSTHAIFIGCQTTVTPFYIDDAGVKYCGNDSVTRKFINGVTSTVSGGSTTVVIGTDGEGNKYFESSYTPSYDDAGLGSVDSDNLLEHIRKGFGLIGTDGYIELSHRFFLGVPSYIWALIAMAMSVNIIVILFKALRGM